MEYGLMITSKQEKFLEDAGIEFNYWDMEGMLLGEYDEQDKIEVVFDTEQERDQAFELIKQIKS